MSKQQVAHRIHQNLFVECRFPYRSKMFYVNSFTVAEKLRHFSVTSPHDRQLNNLTI